jgi:pyridoxal 5'-phosphate synthase pdxT subunit
MVRLTIGVLALQGDFAEHRSILNQLGCDVLLVKHPAQLDKIDGLIIPGGESTTIAKLTDGCLPGESIFETIRKRAQDGMPVYGTCMGTIFLSNDIESSSQGRLSLMNISVCRNAFGPQRFSREEPVNIEALGSDPFPAVFIRAPIITKCGDGVEVLATVGEGIVMARQGNLLATAFHPELTEDIRVHRYFIDMVASAKGRLQSATAQRAIAPTTANGRALASGGHR